MEFGVGMSKSTLKVHRALAKLYGASVLTGTAKQKEWAEKIRYDVLKASALADEEKIELLDVASFIKASKFWIENRHIEPKSFTAKNIVKQYRDNTSKVYYGNNKKHTYLFAFPRDRKWS